MNDSRRNCSGASLLAVLLLVAIFSSTGQIVWADPLDNWHWRNPLPEGNPLQDVRFVAGQFLAVGTAGTILTSPTGNDWSPRQSGTRESLWGVRYLMAFGPGRSLVRAYYRLSPPVARYLERHGWAAVAARLLLTPVVYAIHWSGILLGLAAVVVVGCLLVPLATRRLYFLAGLVLLAPGLVASSALAGPLDSWHWRNPLPRGNHLYAVATANGATVAVGALGTVVTSPDGVAWTARESGTTAELADVAYGNGVYVVVGAGASSSRPPTSRAGRPAARARRATFARWSSRAGGSRRLAVPARC